MPPTADEFREAVSRFATGITVVTCVVDGVDHAMTANAFASVSLEPLLVLVCVERESRFHEAVSVASGWGVSILRSDAEATARWLATKGRPLEGQLERSAHHRSPVLGVALINTTASRSFVAAGYGQSSLNRVSEETGGRAFFQGSTGFVTFDSYFNRLRQELNRQYATAS